MSQMTAHIAEGNKTKEKVKQIKKKREREGFKRNIFFLKDESTSTIRVYRSIFVYVYLFIHTKRR